MFNFKAQLDKKKQEIDRERALAAQTGKPFTVKSRAPVKKVLPWNRRNKGVEERNARDAIAMTTDEVDKHERSREVLEAKAKLYNKMASGEMILDEESSEMFLVDFEQKSVDAWRAKRDVEGTTSANPTPPAMNVNLKDLVKEASSTEKSKKGDEWVEYVDVLGRTRTCRREELHLLHNIDDKLQSTDKPTEKKEKRSLMSDDMRREEEREEWEKQVTEEIEQGKDSYHYEDVRHGEVRELGVGYYAFSRSKEGREAEMKRLMKMREETEATRKQNIENKKKEKTALQARLEKVRQRKIKKLQEQGKKIPAKLLQPIKLKKDEEEQEKKEMETMVEVPTVEQIPVPAETKIREWDKDKELTSIWKPAEPKKLPQNWQDPHETRDNSFAPPKSYFDDQPSITKRHHHNYDVTQHNDNNNEEVEVKKMKSEQQQPISDEDRMRRLLSSLTQQQPTMTSQQQPSTSSVTSQQETVVPVEKVAPPEPFVPAEKPIKIAVKSLPKKNLLLSKSAFEE